MQRKPVSLLREEIPAEFHSFLDSAVVFDSSCSPQAKVWFLDKDAGFYLKTAPKGSLQKEAALTEFFHSKSLGPEVLGYVSMDADWMLTQRLPGEECLFKPYLDDPVRLCDTTAQMLRMLHETPTAGCPVPDRTAEYLAAAQRTYQAQAFDTSLFPDNWGYASAQEAWAVVAETGKYLQTDTLLHGDYCLPNILLDNWKFSGFIDLGAGGVGDKHVDLFWGMWSLQFNLKTDRYCQRFLDAYGRENICEDLFRTVAAIEVFG